ncbi:hypothetical protein Pmar_PMAR015624, partial [Perkinsus marinus ATCC 50983]
YSIVLLWVLRPHKFHHSSYSSPVSWFDFLSRQLDHPSSVLFWRRSNHSSSNIFSNPFLRVALLLASATACWECIGSSGMALGLLSFHTSSCWSSHFAVGHLWSAALKLLPRVPCTLSYQPPTHGDLVGITRCFIPANTLLQHSLS